MKNYLLMFATGLILVVGLNSVSAQDVKIWEDKITIPTYQTGAPDPNPWFYSGRVTQGAQGRVYPYPMSDVLTGEKKDQTYDIIYLENDFVKISVIPELGGRIFTAVDKTNGYDFFYRQTVIKPALIGTLGKWISGGSEWNFPHHHKATTMMRMEHYVQENEDGSVTLWLAETERRHRFRIILTFTLYPGKSYLEMGVNPYNPTPFVHSFLYFANPATHVDSTYQVIFPPNVEYVVQHAKREFIEWPVGTGRYGGKHYDGVDISWWKNLSSPVSFFAWNDEADFFAGYDHGKDAGVAYFANHHTAPGMKFFTFGCGESGKAWDERLTDSDGPYLELMAGVYSDNQPDYSWAQPYEFKNAIQYWYPIRGMGNMVEATVDGAIGLDISSMPKVGLAINTTAVHENAKAVLFSGEEAVWEMQINVGPAQPFSEEVKVPKKTDKFSLKLVLYTAEGSKLLSYASAPKAGEPWPDEVQPPPEPEEMKTVEELYLTGLRLNQFYNAQRDPLPYYEEALKRDPGNYHVNTQLGILDCKGYRWKEAAKHLQTAVDRITYNHTRPKDGEALYYLGVSLRELGKNKEAYDAFYRASWSSGWHSAAYFQLTELDCLKGDYEQALDHVNRSLSTNYMNLRALNLKTIVLRKLGRTDEALKLAGKVLKNNPLDLISALEYEMLKEGADGIVLPGTVLPGLHSDQVETTLETAAYYGNCGCWEEGIAVLSSLDVSIHGKGSKYPLIYYYSGYYNKMLGQDDEAGKYYEMAAGMPGDYCFPYRKESLQVLKDAVRANQEDAAGLYYMGNMLFDHQPEKARKLWEKSRSIDDGNHIVHRNLGIAYESIDEDYAAAIESYEKALEIHADPKIIFELDVLYEKNNTAIDERHAMFSRYSEAVPGRVDAKLRQVLVSIQSENYDDAIKQLTTSHFYRWEGGQAVRAYYEDAYLLRGMESLHEGDIEAALADFEAALEYPANLEEGRPEHDPRFVQTFFLLGLAHEKLGDGKKAAEYFKMSSKEDPERSAYLYYRSMAWSKLGETAKAEEDAKQLKELSERAQRSDFFAKFGERRSVKMRLAEQIYRGGLASLALGDEKAARKAFNEALEANPFHSWAKIHLKGLN